MRCAKSTEQRRARPLCLLPALLLVRALPLYPATAKPPAAQNHRTAGGRSHGGGGVPNHGGPGAHNPDDAGANNLMLLVFKTKVVLVHTIIEVVIQTATTRDMMLGLHTPNHLSSLYQLDRCNT